MDSSGCTGPPALQEDHFARRTACREIHLASDRGRDTHIFTQSNRPQPRTVMLTR